MPLEKIIVVDDDLMVRKTLEDYLRKKRYSVKSVQTIKDAQKQLLKDSYDLIFIDLKLPDGDGMEILKELQQLPNAPMPIMISAHGSMESVIDCIRLGARDYVVKPFDTDQIELVLKRAENYSQLLKVNQFYSEQQNDGIELIGECPLMQNLGRVLRRVAKTEATVLITGENGTGKELVAMELYRNSLLSNQPYIRVNCAAIPENLIESEFFGHEKGAFTGALTRREGRFELANNGTILLDEIGEISPQVQVKLLRVLQEREFERVGGSKTIRVNVRVLATTNRDLLKAVDKGEFREDLYYRLNVFPVHVPPLRERADDILLLAKNFLGKFQRQHNLHIPGFSEDAEKALKEHRWPGNVRELQNTIERAVILAQNGKVIPPGILGIFPAGGQPVMLELDADSEMDSLPTPPPEKGSNEIEVEDDSPPVKAEASEVNGFHNEKGEFKRLEMIEQEQILRALGHTSGNRTKAADILGINIRTLRNKINQYKEEGIDIPT
ncbi:MAG: sigma-54-dependent Fis family transcriptional regulator [Opitutae bacterium]|nr:sigma-54-dependent Fis family transcriptional regulator [Opitutae bacterium]MBT7853695.1 sigma-54-dependent Fis family transcriptional regulator [Opitutae bacterium]